MKNKLGAMTNEKFILCFFTSRLKKKRDFGNLYEVSGPHASILMYNSTQYGTHILGVKFNDSNIGFFNTDVHLSRANNLGETEKTLNAQMDLYKLKVGLLGEVGDITKIRLVDKYNSGAYKTCLTEIEGVKLLVDTRVSFNSSKLLSKQKFANAISNLPVDVKPDGTIKNFAINRVGSKSTTIQEARLSMIPEEAMENDKSFFYGGLWFVPVTDEESFMESSSRDMKLLALPPVRQQYGIPDEYDATDLIIDAIDNQGVAPETLVTLEMLEKIRSFNEAITLYEGVKERQQTIQNIKVNKKLRISSGIVEAGLFVDECEDIYIKGRMFDMAKIGFYEVMENHRRISNGSSDRLGIMLNCLPLSNNNKLGAGKEVTTMERWHKVIPMETIT